MNGYQIAHSKSIIGFCRFCYIHGVLKPSEGKAHVGCSYKTELHTNYCEIGCRYLRLKLSERKTCNRLRFLDEPEYLRDYVQRLNDAGIECGRILTWRIRKGRPSSCAISPVQLRALERLRARLPLRRSPWNHLVAPPSDYSIDDDSSETVSANETPNIVLGSDDDETRPIDASPNLN